MAWGWYEISLLSPWHGIENSTWIHHSSDRTNNLRDLSPYAFVKALLISINSHKFLMKVWDIVACYRFFIHQELSFILLILYYYIPSVECPFWWDLMSLHLDFKQELVASDATQIFSLMWMWGIWWILFFLIFKRFSNVTWAQIWDVRVMTPLGVFVWMVWLPEKLFLFGRMNKISKCYVVESFNFVECLEQVSKLWEGDW